MRQLLLHVAQWRGHVGIATQVPSDSFNLDTWLVELDQGVNHPCIGIYVTKARDSEQLVVEARSLNPSKPRPTPKNVKRWRMHVRPLFRIPLMTQGLEAAKVLGSFIAYAITVGAIAPDTTTPEDDLVRALALHAVI